MTATRPPKSAILLVLALCAAGVQEQARAQALHLASSQTIDARLASRSPAYLFGFANAALAGCNFKPGAALEQLATAVESDEEGVVPDEVRAGFADFSALQQARGTAAACAVAERLFGPYARARPSVLRRY